MTMENGWDRETFALAIALQNLIWGATQPFAGMLADRFGASRVIIGGALLYMAGACLMGQPLGEIGFILTAGVLIGVGQAGTTFPVVFGAVSRALPPQRRSLAMGITMSVGSFGQFAMLPLITPAIDGFGTTATLVGLAILTAFILPLSYFMRENRSDCAPTAGHHGLTAPAVLTAWAALREACGNRDFILLTLGFFVCGFHVVFIALHIPAFLQDQGIVDPMVATMVLALIGLANIGGALFAGYWGGKHSKPYLLSAIYAGRALVILVFIMMPITTVTAYLFAIAMGFLWLSTVSPTNGIIAGVFGVRNMSMLGGVVFFAHQIGAFLGGWLGGHVYDQTGSYDVVWWIAIALGLFAALINLPIKEQPITHSAVVT
jgi:MFS family permease